jgi:general secretion pathway protein I
VKGLSERGFTLLEVLVAFVIAALALAALFDAGVGGIRATQAAAHYQQAIARARSHLALAVRASLLVAGDWQGDDGSGFVWHLRVTPLATTGWHAVTQAALRDPANEPLVLCAVSVWITWRDGGTPREVRLDTEQIGLRPR